MIDAANSLIIKLSDVSSTDNNILFLINIIITIALNMINEDNVAMTISLIIFKNKLIKLKIMRA